MYLLLHVEHGGTTGIGRSGEALIRRLYGKSEVLDGDGDLVSACGVALGRSWGRRPNAWPIRRRKKRCVVKTKRIRTAGAAKKLKKGVTQGTARRWGHGSRNTGQTSNKDEADYEKSNQ